MKTPPTPILALWCLAALGASQPAAAADQARKKVHAPSGATTGAAAPSRATDLNSPATDFSGVSPVIEDPKAEMLRPRKRKDANFD